MNFNNRKTCTDAPDKLLLVSRKKDIRVRQLAAKNSLNEHDMVSSRLILSYNNSQVHH